MSCLSFLFPTGGARPQTIFRLYARCPNDLPWLCMSSWGYIGIRAGQRTMALTASIRSTTADLGTRETGEPSTTVRQFSPS